MKKRMKRILTVAFGLILLAGALPAHTAHADVAEPCDVHTYSYDCDTDCNICGYERVTKHTYDRYGQNFSYHWLKCVCGAKLDMEAHVYDSTTDLTCSVCGYERHLEHNYSTQKSDGTYHWDECSCGETKNKEEHTLVQKSDGSWHWDQCVECNERVNVGAHVWGEGRTEGTITYYTCTICGAEKTVDVTGGGQGVTPGTNPGDGTGDTPGGENPTVTPGGENPGVTPGGTQGENPGEGTGENQGGEGTGENAGEGDDTGDDSGDDTKNKKKNGGGLLFGILGGVVALWAGAIGGYLAYRKTKGGSVASMKGKVKDTL